MEKVTNRINSSMLLSSKLPKRKNKSFYTPKDKYVRNIFRETVKRGRVTALNHKFVSSSFNEKVEILEKYFGKGLELSVSIEKNSNFLMKSKKIMKTNINQDLVIREEQIKNFLKIY